MNESGRSVGPARGSLHLAPEQVIVVHDEIDLPFGEVRSRLGGGLAGHNGLKSITTGARQRASSGACAWASGGPTSTDPEIVSRHVLGRFQEVPEQVRELIERASGAVEELLAASARGGRARLMALASLLGLIARGSRRRARSRARVDGPSCRRFASLRDRGPGRRRAGRRATRPTLVVAGDDRAARDLAADLRSWLSPRRVRYYPSRGVAYESHLTPPPHLVGLRVAALDALLASATAAEEPPVVVVSAVALSEKVPDPELRPRSFRLRVGELLDLEECAEELVEAGYERVDQVAGARPVRGARRACSMSSRRPRSGPCGWTCSTWRSNRCTGSRPSRSARSKTPAKVEIAPAAELAFEHRELAELAASSGAFEPAAAGGRPDIAELLPVERFGALLDLLDGATELIVAAEEELAPALRDNWEDVCAAFADQDAHHLYVDPEDGHGRAADARTDVAVRDLGRPAERSCVPQSADVAARSLAEAEPQLEKLLRSGYRTVVAFPRRGEGERMAFNLGRAEGEMARRRRGRGGGPAWRPRCGSPRPRCGRGSSPPR